MACGDLAPDMLARTVVTIDELLRGVEEGERCPKATARAKQEAAVTLAGVAVASSCQIILPVFGALFCIVGMVLTIASYRGQEANELPEQYADRVSRTSNLRILGPVCLAIGVGMAVAGATLIYIARRNKQNNITFHCPIHGDFYPISASHSHLLNMRKRSSLGIFGPADTEVLPTPQCPHSNRSSVSTGPPAQLSPLPPVITSSGYLTASNLLQFGDSGGSTLSLAMSYDVASFPHSRSASPYPDHPENEREDVPRASTAT
uniref:Transmembrane protein n=2 Tax=Lygus hesperus TaxID=30085 RepID=A0A0K8SK78_LYGHE